MEDMEVHGLIDGSSCIFMHCSHLNLSLLNEAKELEKAWILWSTQPVDSK